MKRVVVVGGGISGLATALHLRDRAAEVAGGLEVVVLEAADRPGGNIRTDRAEGYTIEAGPNGFLDNVPATLELVRRLGLEGQLQRADETAARRFLYRKGRLHLLPSGALSFLRSPVLSPGGRLRVLAEPFARPRPPGAEESVYAFAARRIGPEAASVLVDAMVSGVFAGNVHELSLRSAFPKMAAMEDQHGGLVRAMVSRMGERRAARKEARARADRGEDVAELTRAGGPAGPGGTLTSFTRGLDTLVDGLAAAVGDSLRLRSPVRGVRRTAEELVPPDAAAGALWPERVSRPWTVELASGDEVHADAVVVAAPSPHAAPLLQPLDPVLGMTVAEIHTAGLAVVALGYRAEDARDVHGFGFLVPRGAGPRILGCLWDSSIFPGRAPDGEVLVRVMIGGAHDPSAVAEEESTLVARVRRDLETTMGLVADPVLTRVYRWPLGIAQYRLGHQDRLDRIHARLRENPGLWVAGSSFYGISMNACFERAPVQAAEILEFLQGSSLPA
jgi:protoporphyrinogen/coproporphyrinogen III oxidase